jgi:anti-sigma factor RsiW
MSDTVDKQHKHQWDGAGFDEAATNDTDDGAQGETLLLMSLALDGLLDGEEEERLQARVAQDAALAATWRQWQRMDTFFHAASRAEPAPGFTARFEAKLEARTRRERVRSGIVYAVAGAVVWIAALAAVLLLGRFVWVNQAEWVSSFMHQVTVYPSAAMIWLQALRSTATAMLNTPQTLAMMAGYCVAAVALLAAWLRYLQRSAQKEVVSYVQSH